MTTVIGYQVRHYWADVPGSVNRGFAEDGLDKARAWRDLLRAENPHDRFEIVEITSTERVVES
jgi:hypothetical protein